jgi:hypothetical protein
MAPEIYQGHKYTKASDIFIFWNDYVGINDRKKTFLGPKLLYGEIYDGLRPPIATNAPEGYIELMEECWHFDPDKRPIITDTFERIKKICIRKCK